MNKASAAFFRRVKAGDKPGCPRFKNRVRLDTVEFPEGGDGCRWNSTPDDRQTRVRLQGVSHMRVHQRRPIQGRVRTVSELALAVVRGYDTIAVEALNIAGMTRAPEPDQPGVFLPNHAAAKAGLNRSVLDAGWGQFLGILAGKAEKAGRCVIPVDARDTFRACPHCGHVARENRVTQAEFTCQRCRYTANADIAGSLNIAFRAGLVLRAAA